MTTATAQRRVLCGCGNLLGFTEASWFHTRHRGRTMNGALPVQMQCEDCHRWTNIDMEKHSKE